MRVLFLSGSGGLGGAERALVDIIASLRLAQPSWTLHLIAPSDGPLVAASTCMGATADVLPLGEAVSRLGESSADRATPARRSPPDLQALLHRWPGTAGN